MKKYDTFSTPIKHSRDYNYGYEHMN